MTRLCFLSLTLLLTQASCLQSTTTPSPSGNDTTNQTNSNSDPTRIPGSLAGQCALHASNLTSCVEYTGAKYRVAAVQETCANQNGTFGTTACSRDSFSGSCDVSQVLGAGLEARYFYYGATIDAMQASCADLKGVFTKAASGIGCAGDDGKAYADGASETRRRFQKATPPCTSQSQTRMCVNGMWTAWGGDYKEESCYSCAGQATSCTSITTKESCNRHDGCLFGLCEGSGQPCQDPSHIGKSECDTLSHQGFDCQWNPGAVDGKGKCDGVATACSAILEQEKCNTGCSWQPAP